MSKAFCSASLLWLVFACLHTVFASGQNYKIEEASHSFSSLCSFKPLPKLRYIDAKDLYKYKPSTGIFLNQSTSNLIDQESNWSQMLGFDPVRFSLKVSKDSLRIDEEFEIVITAEYIKINPRAIFTLESFNEYTLRLLIPEGFINTGGDYYDFIKGKVSENSHKQIYTLKGKFVNISNSS